VISIASSCLHISLVPAKPANINLRSFLFVSLAAVQ
jgi:hypothetical protein